MPGGRPQPLEGKSTHEHSRTIDHPRRPTMTMFTDAEQSYLDSQPLGRLATLGPDGSPQTRPVGYTYNRELNTIDIGGHNLTASRKYRNIQADARVSFVVDDLASV